MFALLLLLLPSLCQSLPHSQELKNCDSSGPRVSALSLNSALSTFLCYTEKELAAMEEEQKKRKLALKIAPSIRHAESGGFEKLVEVLTDMKEENLVKIVNVVINNESNEGERKTLPEYIQVIVELIGETGVESELAKNLHLVSLLKSDLEGQGRGGRGAFGLLALNIIDKIPKMLYGMVPFYNGMLPTTVAPGSTAASTTAASSTGGSTAVTTTATSSTGGSTASSSTGGSTATSSTGGSTAASTTVGSIAASTTASTAASTAGASTVASTTGASTAASTTGASTASSTAAAFTTAVSTAASTTAASTTGASTAASTTVASTTGASTATSTTVASTTGVTTASTTVASTATSTTASTTGASTASTTAASTTGASTAASTTVSTTAASTAASTTVASTVATTTAAPPTCPGNSDEVSAVDCDCGGNICTGGTQGCETAVSLCRDVCLTVDAPIGGNDPCFCKLQGSSAADLCAVGQTCSSTTGLCT